MKKQKQSLTPAASVPSRGQYLDYVKNGEVHRINATLIDSDGSIYNETITDSIFDLILFLEAGWQRLGKSKVLYVSYSPKFDSRFFLGYLHTSGVKLIGLSRFNGREKELAEMFMSLKEARKK